MAPPVHKGGLVVWSPGSHPEPGKHLVPDLPGEGALQHEVPHGFGCLVAEEASRMMWEAMSC
jgi:hypothetical protein